MKKNILFKSLKFILGFGTVILFGASALVSWGTRGELVRQTQQKLADLGYYRGVVDGVYGEKTYEAISAFQRSVGLRADGMAGEQTLLYLGLADASSNISANNFGYTESEIFSLASVIHGEARGEPYEGQVAVGAVVLNRVNSSDFPNTINGVIYQNGAFDAVRDGQINLSPNESSVQAAKDAIAGWDPVNGALYYWNPVTATSRWIWSIPITNQIGRHVFGVGN